MKRTPGLFDSVKSSLKRRKSCNDGEPFSEMYPRSHSYNPSQFGQTRQTERGQTSETRQTEDTRQTESYNIQTDRTDRHKARQDKGSLGPWVQDRTSTTQERFQKSDAYKRHSDHTDRLPRDRQTAQVERRVDRPVERFSGIKMESSSSTMTFGRGDNDPRRLSKWEKEREEIDRDIANKVCLLPLHFLDSINH
jgi:hypothetical protein